MQLYWTIETASPGTFNATEFEAALDDELITVAGITDLAREAALRQH